MFICRTEDENHFKHGTLLQSEICFQVKVLLAAPPSRREQSPSEIISPALNGRQIPLPSGEVSEASTLDLHHIYGLIPHILKGTFTQQI